MIVVTSVDTGVVTVSTPSRHRRRAISPDISNASVVVPCRFRLRLNTLFVVFVCFQHALAGRAAGVAHERRGHVGDGLMPRDRRPAGRQSLVRVRARTRPRSSKHRWMERPQPRGARPAEYRRPASRPGRSAIPTTRITNTLVRAIGHPSAGSGRPIVLLGRRVMRCTAARCRARWWRFPRGLPNSTTD